MTIGPLTFLAPLALLGLLALPVIWWILRVTPPRPQQTTFPPLRILQDVITDEETPNSTPLWLLIFRLLMAALLAIALAQPILSRPEADTDRPLVLILETGWDAANNWSAMINEAENRISNARRKNLDVLLATTAQPSAELTFGPAQIAMDQLKTLRPRSLDPDHAGLAETFGASYLSGANVVWLSTGVDFGGGEALAQALSEADTITRLAPASAFSPLIPTTTEESADGFRSQWTRIDTRGLRSSEISAHGRDGEVIGRADLTFTPGAAEAEASFDLPTELRNRITVLRAAGSASAGSVKLLDDSWGRPLLGLLTGGSNSGSPLLSEDFYTQTALQPYADIYSGSLDDLLPLGPSVIVMTDEARTEDPALREFVEAGGLLIRFAGPKLASRADDLVPVRLRSGGRDLGGALTWEDPQSLAPFSDDSPFFGLNVPDDITVTRQVMAEPGAETDARTWARLEDGSPIVTSNQVGFGRVVLFHVTAGPEWSNLAIGGLYVEMLQRMMALARPSAPQVQSTGGNWAPERVLTGFGRLTSPGIEARPISDANFEQTEVSAEHPPGLYRQGARRKALNMIDDPSRLSLLGNLGGVTTRAYGEVKDQTLGGILLAIALIMLALDALFALIASGRLAYLNPRRIMAAAVIGALSISLMPQSGWAQEPAAYDIEALEMHLAFVETGDSGTDWLSEQAMNGLVRELTNRTTIEPYGVRGVDVETDTLVYYPFLYWPVKRDAPPLSPEAVESVNDYMAGGGTIVFDTQDAGDQAILGTQHPGLARITADLDVPQLIEVPEDHVLTKSFYLLQVYPGRWANGRVWVDENMQGGARDGVSSVIIGSNDWAAGWAQGENGESLASLEREIANQREMSVRFGINVAMYALSGNYKSDQVHAAALVERLGQRDLAPQNLGPAGRDQE